MRRKLLIIVATATPIVLVATFVEGPPRQLAPEERIPARIVVQAHQKSGGRVLATLTNRADIVEVMTAMPSSYSGPYCACFGQFDLAFYAPTGVYRTVNCKIGEYVRDSDHPTGQAGMPRRFKRIIRKFISQGE